MTAPAYSYATARASNAVITQAVQNTLSSTNKNIAFVLSTEDGKANIVSPKLTVTYPGETFAVTKLSISILKIKNTGNQIIPTGATIEMYYPSSGNVFLSHPLTADLAPNQELSIPIQPGLMGSGAKYPVRIVGGTVRYPLVKVTATAS